MGRKLFSTGRFHRRQSRSAARSMSMANDEARAVGGAAAAGEFESTASLSSSGRNNPSAFNGVSPNANSTSFRAIQLQQMDLLMTAIQKLSDAVDSNTSAIRDMQLQNNQVQEFMPNQQMRTSPTNEHNARSEPRQQEAFDIFIPSPSDQRSSSSDSCSSSSSSSGVSDEGLDRKQTRLDGLEVYAVVSAVTAGTLVAVFDSYHPGDILDLFASGRLLELCLSLLFTATGAFGIVCGLHCIFVFSLITMYGRTALGMERDDALEIFFSGTGLQRYHGFKTFVASLYSLGTCLLVVIASKISSNPTIHLLALMISAKLMHYVYRDTQDIMSKATVIFAPPAAAPSSSISSSHKMEESTVMEVEVEEALDMEDVEKNAEKESNAQQQMIASTNDHHSLSRSGENLDGNKDNLPQDDATKSQSATTETSSKKDKQNRSRRRRSSLGLSAAEHIAIEEQKCASSTTKKRASAMTLSATDLMGANADISRSSSTIAASPDQKTKRGKAATTRSADATRIEKLDHGNKSDVQEPTGNAVRSTVESTGDNIQDLVQQKDYRSVWKAAAREAVATATNNEEGTNQNRKETDRSDDDNSDTDDGSDNSADARRLANLLASKQEGWQQQAWLAALAAARHHNHHHHHHGQHHGKRHSSAMNQSATDHIKMDAPVALSTMNLFGGVHGRRASNSSRAPSA